MKTEPFVVNVGPQQWGGEFRAGQEGRSHG
jgi:hypothetical protein